MICHFVLMAGMSEKGSALLYNKYNYLIEMKTS